MIAVCVVEIDIFGRILRRGMGSHPGGICCKLNSAMGKGVRGVELPWNPSVGRGEALDPAVPMVAINETGRTASNLLQEV